MVHSGNEKYAYLEEINEGIFKHIPSSPDPEVMVLDVGCGFGSLSAVIQQKKGYTTWGIEINEDAVSIACKRITKVIQADLTDMETVASLIGDIKFDYVVFSDVLEHLPDPHTVLRAYIDFLKQGGVVLVSVPNVAVWSNRLAFLFGKFEYSDTGVMDRTHMRFFTFRTARVLVEGAGCKIRKIDYTPFLVRAFLPFVKKLLLNKVSERGIDSQCLVRSPIYKAYMKYFYPIEHFVGSWWKSMFAFRIIIVGEKL